GEGEGGWGKWRAGGGRGGGGARSGKGAVGRRRAHRRRAGAPDERGMGVRIRRRAVGTAGNAPDRKAGRQREAEGCPQGSDETSGEASGDVIRVADFPRSEIHDAAAEPRRSVRR